MLGGGYNYVVRLWVDRRSTPIRRCSTAVRITFDVAHPGITQWASSRSRPKRWRVKGGTRLPVWRAVNGESQSNRRRNHRRGLITSLAPVVCKSASRAYVALSFAEFVAVISAFVKKYRFYSTPCGCLMSVCPLKFSWFSLVCRSCFYLFCSHSRLLVPFISSCKMWYVCFYFICIFSVR